MRTRGLALRRRQARWAAGEVLLFSIPAVAVVLAAAGVLLGWR